MVSVLFVCLGNICRSPSAEAVFRKLLADQDLQSSIECDSAGTSAWHIGSPPDERAVAVGLQRGVDMRNLRGRQVGKNDFSRFDYILAMDEDNLRHLRGMKPDDYGGVLDLFLSFSQRASVGEVPDPYYGGRRDFEHVFDLLEGAAQGLLDDIRRHMQES